MTSGFVDHRTSVYEFITILPRQGQATFCPACGGSSPAISHCLASDGVGSAPFS